MTCDDLWLLIKPHTAGSSRCICVFHLFTHKTQRRKGGRGNRERSIVNLRTQRDPIIIIIIMRLSPFSNTKHTKSLHKKTDLPNVIFVQVMVQLVDHKGNSS